MTSGMGKAEEVLARGPVARGTSGDTCAIAAGVGAGEGVRASPTPLPPEPP